ncbi:MAG: hypothetical protein R3C62_10555 [Chloroflexota bacterium]
MKNLLSSTLFVVLLAAFGFVAYAAFPGGAEITAGSAPATDMGFAQSAPAAPAATINWSNIAIPLDAGITTADAVANYIANNGSIQRVAKWDSATQSLIVRNVGAGFGTPNFSVAVGDWLLVGANSSAPSSFAWVGDVPSAGSRDYDLVANGWTSLMLPLDQGSITTADALGTTIGNVTRVARWDANSQAFVIRNVGAGFGTPNFSIQIGYPYLVYSTAATNWP